MTNSNYITMKIERETLERLKIISWFYDVSISKIINDSLDSAKFPDLESLKKRKAEIQSIKTPFD